MLPNYTIYLFFFEHHVSREQKPSSTFLQGSRALLPSLRAHGMPGGAAPAASSPGSAAPAPRSSGERPARHFAPKLTAVLPCLRAKLFDGPGAPGAGAAAWPSTRHGWASAPRVCGPSAARGCAHERHESRRFACRGQVPELPFGQTGAARPLFLGGARVRNANHGSQVVPGTATERLGHVCPRTACRQVRRRRRLRSCSINGL